MFVCFFAVKGGWKCFYGRNLRFRDWDGEKGRGFCVWSVGIVCFYYVLGLRVRSMADAWGFWSLDSRPTWILGGIAISGVRLKVADLRISQASVNNFFGLELFI